jgi:hydroxyacylglutathione hydrolase
MLIEQFIVDGLGCASYLIGSEADRVAAVVDPERDLQKYLDLAKEKQVRITHIIETHLHADHVSGNTELAARTGAKIYIHAAAGVNFPHEALQDGDVLELGDVRLLVRHTPGHTPESIILLVSEPTRSLEPTLALTGDLLIAGDVGRPDLVGPEAARGLADQLYDNLFADFLKGEDSLTIYPGHGAGSLPGRAIGSSGSNTPSYERQHNPALALHNRQEFIDFMTTDLPEQPANHTRIQAINRQGPRPLGEVIPKPIPVRDSIPFFQRGAGMLDTRSQEAYVKLHVPGAVHLEADERLSHRAGLILPPELPLILLVEDEPAYRKVVLSLARVGVENVVGYLPEGIDGWEALGLPVMSGDIQDVSPAELDTLLKSPEKPLLIDVREPWEYLRGHIPGAVLIPLGELPNRVQELDAARPIAVVCQSGSRSQSAAALLGQKGFPKVYNLYNGTGGWEREGLPLAYGRD